MRKKISKVIIPKVNFRKFTEFASFKETIGPAPGTLVLQVTKTIRMFRWKFIRTTKKK
tara:strand:+ start:7553 stop:7726 length:174 start_codon:yes stop_codon:yes gene_type:complete